MHTIKFVVEIVDTSKSKESEVEKRRQEDAGGASGLRTHVFFRDFKSALIPVQGMKFTIPGVVEQKMWNVELKIFEDGSEEYEVWYVCAAGDERMCKSYAEDLKLAGWSIHDLIHRA